MYQSHPNCEVPLQQRPPRVSRAFVDLSAKGGMTSAGIRSVTQHLDSRTRHDTEGQHSDGPGLHSTTETKQKINKPSPVPYLIYGVSQSGHIHDPHLWQARRAKGEAEEVKVTSVARLRGGRSQRPTVTYHVDERRLADVGAANENDLRRPSGAARSVKGARHWRNGSRLGRLESCCCC